MKIMLPWAGAVFFALGLLVAGAEIDPGHDWIQPGGLLAMGLGAFLARPFEPTCGVERDRRTVTDQIPLAEAVLCLDCNTLRRCGVEYCPRCAGGQWIPLDRWLRANGGVEVSHG